MWNILRKLFNVPEPTGTVVRLDDLEIGDGDKLCVFYPGTLTQKQRERLVEMMDGLLGNDNKRILVFDSGAQLQVIKNGSKLHKLMDGKET